MFVYGISLATAGNLTTNAVANTETETWFIKPGSGRTLSLLSVYLLGKGAGLTTISGIVARIMEWGTASTAGTAITPAPKDDSAPAANCTAASRPTAGSTRQNHLSFGCGAAGPGGWVAPNPDAMITLPASSAKSTSMADASGTASLNFEFSGEIVE